jgi:putative ATPase
MLGLPEARLPLAQAVVQLSLAPKSNSVLTAIDAALGDVAEGRSGPVPAQLRDRHSGSSAESTAYRYPHDDPLGVVAQQYSPDALRHARYLMLGERGEEAMLAERYRRIRAVLDVASPPERADPLG